MRLSLRRNPASASLIVGRVSRALRAAPIGQRVGALVAGVARMAAHPAPFHVVQVAQRIEPLPQLGVLHGLLVRGLPAALLPAVDPFGDALAHVFAVGVDRHVAGALEGGERLDHRGELHAVVGRRGFAAEELLLVAIRAEPGAPAAASRVALARAVCVDGHVRSLDGRGGHETSSSTRPRWWLCWATTAGAAFAFARSLRTRPTSRMPRTRFTAVSA